MRNRETVKEREGGQNVYMLCSSTQHQPAYGSPAVLVDKTVSMRESKEERREGTITKEGREGTREAQLQERD